MTGTDGDDFLWAEKRGDRLAGGDGNDDYHIHVDRVTVIEAPGEGNDTVYTSMRRFTLPANVENLVFNDEGAAALTGNGLSNGLVGADGNDTLDGQGGDDSMWGEDGNDTLLGGEGNDMLLGGAGNDTLLGGVGNDELAGGAGNDSVDGGNGDDTLWGEDGDDTLQGGAGDDHFVTGAGNATIRGGTGEDYLWLPEPVANYVRERTGETALRLTSTVTGAVIDIADVEHIALDGTSYSFAGLASNLPSRWADMLYTAGPGTTLAGGMGDDTYVVRHAGAVITESANGGRDTVQSERDFTLGDGVENLVLVGTAALRGTGNALNNALTGNAASNVLDGGAGKDTMTGGAGSDTYVVDNAGDVIVEAAGDAGTDRVEAKLASYTLAANVENLYAGLDGNFTGNGNAGANRITGRAGNDKLSGNDGNDTLDGGAGNDKLLGGAGHDEFIGGAGNDTFDGGAADGNLDYADYWQARGGVKVDLAAGKADDGEGGTDSLINIGGVLGSTFDDTLTGKSGNGREYFDGGRGSDTIDGGAIRGADLNMASYGSETAGIIVDLGTGRAVTASGTDVLLNMNMVIGSWYDDSITGSDGPLDERFEGNAGNDTLDGAGGFDYVVYTNTNSAGVTVDLAAGTGIEAAGDTDTLRNIEGVIGTLYDDMLTGSDNRGRDVEVFIGAAGNDTIDGGLGRDIVDYAGYAAGGVRVDLGAGTAQDGAGGTDTLRNIEGAWGTAFNDTLTGGAGNDLLAGRAGNDLLDGGAGKDIADYRGAGAAVSASLVTGKAGDGDRGTDTLRNIESLLGSGFNDRLTGDANANALSGEDGNDTLDGGAGDDALGGGAGNDSLAGGAGDDWLHGGGGNDTLDGGAGTDVLELDGALADYTLLRLNANDLALTHRATGATVLARNVESVFVAGQALAMADVLYNVASNGNDTLAGDEAGEVLAGGAGDDLYIVTHAGVSITEAARGGTDTVRAEVDFALAANVEKLVLAGAAVAGTGNELANTITGNDFGNLIDGGAGRDTLAGGNGDDRYIVDNSGDTVQEAAGGGIDTVVTALASLVLAKNVERLEFTGDGNHAGTGNELANVLIGRGGNDMLSGAAGDDVLVAGTGADTLTGGAGADTFHLDIGKADTVTDFVSGTDRIVFDAVAGAIGNGDAVLDAGELTIVATNAKALTAAAAAGVIGGAAARDDTLFVIDNGRASAVFLYRAADGDGTVSAAELALVATLTGAKATVMDDFAFGTYA